MANFDDVERDRAIYTEAKASTKLLSWASPVMRQFRELTSCNLCVADVAGSEGECKDDDKGALRESATERREARAYIVYGLPGLEPGFLIFSSIRFQVLSRKTVENTGRRSGDSEMGV